MSVKKTTILVADDDPQLLRLVERNLELEGYSVLIARDGEQALELVAAHEPDLLLLDIMMPRMDGYTVCQRVREFSQVPILVVTARGQEQEKVRGLDLGADDYLSKPFSIEELLARVRAVLRRVGFPADAYHGRTTLMRASISIGELNIDFRQHLVKKAGQELVLTLTEYRLLAYFLHHAGRVLPQDDLLEHVWGREYVGARHLLQVNINRLRRKVEPDPSHPHSILTKAGIGYLFALPPLHNG